MLFASPKGLFGSSFELSTDGVRTVGLIELLLAKSYSRITLSGQVYRASFHGTFEREYKLETISGDIYATATSTLLSGRFDLKYDGRAYTLKAEPGIRNVTFILLDGDKHMGSIRSEGFFRQKFLIDCPDALPLALQAFWGWMVIMATKRSVST